MAKLSDGKIYICGLLLFRATGNRNKDEFCRLLDDVFVALRQLLRLHFDIITVTQVSLLPHDPFPWQGPRIYPLENSFYLMLKTPSHVLMTFVHFLLMGAAHLFLKATAQLVLSSPPSRTTILLQIELSLFSSVSAI